MDCASTFEGWAAALFAAAGMPGGLNAHARLARSDSKAEIEMKRTLLAMAALAGMAVGQASAATTPIYFSGPGVSGTLVITYGPATDLNYPNAFEITGISGVFSDSNNGLDIVDAPVGPLVAINNATPESTNLLAPNDFSRFPVTAGLPSENNGFLTYDNLFWPSGAPATASDFDGAGGFLDIYGLMFSIGGGVVVDLFDNGVGAITGIDYGGYGVAVATAEASLDYVADGVTASTPEPSTWAMMILGFAGLGFAGYRKSRTAAAVAA
jgi:PEP-CTERM motif